MLHQIVGSDGSEAMENAGLFRKWLVCTTSGALPLLRGADSARRDDLPSTVEALSAIEPLMTMMTLGQRIGRLADGCRPLRGRRAACPSRPVLRS
jgi:hypothetical protein